MPKTVCFFLSKCRKFVVFLAHFVAFFGLVLGCRNDTVLAVALVSLQVSEYVMPVFEEWFEYDYEEVLLGAVKAETKRRHHANAALRLRHRRPPTPQK
jgi:hypothetical protein